MSPLHQHTGARGVKRTKAHPTGVHQLTLCTQALGPVRKCERSSPVADRVKQMCWAHGDHLGRPHRLWSQSRLLRKARPSLHLQADAPKTGACHASLCTTHNLLSVTVETKSRCMRSGRHTWTCRSTAAVSPHTSSASSLPNRRPTARNPTMWVLRKHTAAHAHQIASRLGGRRQGVPIISTSAEGEEGLWSHTFPSSRPLRTSENPRAIAVRRALVDKGRLA